MSGNLRHLVLTCALYSISCTTTPHPAPWTPKSRSHSPRKSSLLSTYGAASRAISREKAHSFDTCKFSGSHCYPRIQDARILFASRVIFINFSPHLFLSHQVESVQLWWCSHWMYVTGHGDPGGTSRMKTGAAALGKNPLLSKQDVFPPRIGTPILEHLKSC